MKATKQAIDTITRINDCAVPTRGDAALRMKQARCWSRKGMWGEFHTNWVGLWPEDVEAVIAELEELRGRWIDKERGKI